MRSTSRIARAGFVFTQKALPIIALIGLVNCARAQTLTWDADQTPPASGSTGATTAVWDSGTRWFNGSTDQAWDNTGTIDTVFPTGAGTATIGSSTTINLQSINFTNTAGNYVLGGASLSLATSTANGTISFSQNDGTIGVIANALGQGVNSNLTGTNLWINNTGNGTTIPTITVLGGNNYLTGTIYLSGTNAATAFNARNVLSPTPFALGTQDGTSTFSSPAITFVRDFSQINFGTGFDNNSTQIATFNNNIYLNPDNIDTGTFNAGLGVLPVASRITLNGVISGNSILSFTIGLSGGQGVLILNKNNTYTGDTGDFEAAQSIVRLGIDNALPTTTGFNFGPVNGGTTQTPGALDLNGHSQTLTYITTTINDGTGTGATGYAGGIVNDSSSLATLTINGTVARTYRSPIGTGGGLSQTNMDGTKSTNIRLVFDPANTGTLTLATGNMGTIGFSVNDYSGGTDVRGGTLYVNTTNGTGTLASGTGSGSVTVGNGTATARIGGNGPITGDLHLNNLGQVSPGSTGSNIGILHTGNEEWGAGASYSFDISDATGVAGTGYDQVKLDKNSGAVNVTSTTGNKFTILINGAPTNLGTTHDWIVADGTGNVQLNGTAVDASAAAAFNAGGWMNYFVIDNSNFTNNAGIQSVQISGDLTDIVVHYEVPEPSCMAMLLAGAGLLLRRNKRRPLAA